MAKIISAVVSLTSAVTNEEEEVVVKKEEEEEMNDSETDSLFLNVKEDISELSNVGEMEVAERKEEF